MKNKNISMLPVHLMLNADVRYIFLLKTGLLLILLFPAILNNIFAQASFDENEVHSFTYDDFPVLVMVEGYGNFYVDALYANDDKLYVNIMMLFQQLGISCQSGQNGEIITGFIANENQQYLVDLNQKLVTVGLKNSHTGQGLVKEMGLIFMETSLFDQIFGITLTFNFRALTIILKSRFELPVVKQQRIEKMRRNLSALKGETLADTVIRRNYHMFRFGSVDWSVASYQTWKGSVHNRFGLALGTELLYGEADISLLYYDNKKFENRQLHYLWRWVDNDKKIIKQAQLGRISNQTIAFIDAPVIGAVIRNSPTTVRKAKGYYTISEFTKPDWTIELYVNNVMIDYTKADASGFFVFKVPNIYGYTTLKLKFYGPSGEERTEERTMNIPYTVMPAGEIEYSLSAGILQNDQHSGFGRGEVNYGLNRMITLGGGFEYLSSISGSPFIPFIKTTIQPFNQLTLTGEYVHGVKTGGFVDYYIWKEALVEVEYTKFVKGQLATRFNALEERKVKFSKPFRIHRVICFSQFDYTQYVYKGFIFNQSNLSLSVYYKQFSAGSATQFNRIDKNPFYMTSSLSLSYRLKGGYTIRPSAQYSVGDNKLMSYKTALEKSIPHGHFAIAYERNLVFDDHFVSLNIRYDLNFVRTGISVMRSKSKMYTAQSAQGSLAFGSGNNHIQTSNNTSVGRGGISLYPFLDLNQNGIFDPEEPMVKLTSLRVTGGKAVFSEKDSIVRIPNLYAFTSCIFELNDSELENISWRFKAKKYEVVVDPNQFKRIDIPVISVGEANGMVYLNKNNELKGLGRILVKFYDKKSRALVAETLSESDGYISYLGLDPGEYSAQVDSVQLKNLDYIVYPETIDFTVKSTEEGEIFSKLDFILNYKYAAAISANDSLNRISSDEIEFMAEKAGEINDSMDNGLEDQSIKISISSIRNKAASDLSNEFTIVWGDVCTQPGMYCVQCGAFRRESYAMRMALRIKQITDFEVGIVLHNGLYKVRVGCVLTRRESSTIKKLLVEKGVGDDLFIVIRK